MRPWFPSLSTHVRVLVVVLCLSGRRGELRFLRLPDSRSLWIGERNELEPEGTGSRPIDEREEKRNNRPPGDPPTTGTQPEGKRPPSRTPEPLRLGPGDLRIQGRTPPMLCFSHRGFRPPFFPVGSECATCGSYGPSDVSRGARTCCRREGNANARLASSSRQTCLLT